MRVGVELPDIPASDLSAVRIVLREAVDDKGNTLFEPQEEEPGFSPVQGMPGRKDPSRKAFLDIGLMNPARDATKIAKVSGEIDLYMPSRDPGAVVTVPKIVSKGGKALDLAPLKASGVSITVIDPASREAEKKKAVEEKRRELKEEGYEDEDIAWRVEDFAEYFYVPAEGELAMRIDDPEERVQSLELVGDDVMAYVRYEDDLTVLSTYGTPLGDDVGLKISLRTPKTVSRHTFELLDVPLP